MVGGASFAYVYFKLRRKDGSAIWVDVQGTPMHNAAGVFTGIIGRSAFQLNYSRNGPARKTARQAEVLANRIKDLGKKVAVHSWKCTLAAAGYANERGYLPKHYPDLRPNRNNLASEFLVCEIRSGIIALAMVAKVMPLPPYPRANCAPGKSL
jgi:hypothetical protein